MFKHVHAQRGFGVIGIVLALVVVLAGSFASWYAWQSHRDATKLSTTTVASQTVTTTSTSTPVVSTENSLDIKEWGVRIIAAAKMPAATYRLSTSGGIDWALLEFAGLPDDCKGNYRFSRSQPGNEIDGYGHSPEKLLETDPTVTKKIGNYYYYFGRGEQSCDINNRTLDIENGFVAGITGGNNGYSVEEIHAKEKE